MDLNEPGNDSPRPLRGFRKRWTSDAASGAASSDGRSALGDFDPAFRGDALDSAVHTSGFSDLGSWTFLQPAASEQYEPESPIDLYGDEMPGPVVFDPNRTEPSWINSALETASKRQKMHRPKLPWETGAFSQIFRTGDVWQDTILSGLTNRFVPTGIGCEDVLNSRITDKPHVEESATEFVPPVIQLNLKKVRRELPDEDIRRMALCKLRDLILQDPMATQLGVSICNQARFGASTALAEQSINDCFRMKASSTLQKRAGSLWRLAKLLRGMGQLNFLRLTEEQLYLALCEMRESGAGATSAQHMIEALHFLDASVKFLLVDLRAVVSGRCKGVAKDMYLTKNPLDQKHPLLLAHVRHLESLFHTLPNTMKCILGQLLFCIHACCRWKDAQRVKSLSLERGHGEVLIHAEALQSKTATTAEARTRFLPYIALGTGVTGQDWGSEWIAARQSENLCFDDFILPSFSERVFMWTSSPMSASEATFWLREFLEGAVEPGVALKFGSHSCKSTVLTWTGRCLKVAFTPTDRRLLGHHLEANMKSILTYSRESYVTLYSKVLQMFRLMRENQFDPDLSAIDRVVQLSEEPLPETSHDMAVESLHADDGSDSESSVASECGDIVPSAPCLGRDGTGLTSLFPDFPGVPEASLVMHRVSGLIHVLNEDGFLTCGRQASANFVAYDKILGDRSLGEGCSHCKRKFMAQGSQP